MTDKALGTAAGDIFAKAFALGYETGRDYIPPGGMALTAEQAEDVRIVLNKFGFNQVTPEVVQAIEASKRLTLALFPATEPAEDGWGDVNPDDPQGRTYRETAEEYYSAPAEPAEEETKAEEWPVHDSWCTGTHGRAGNCIDTSRWIDPLI